MGGAGVEELARSLVGRGGGTVERPLAGGGTFPLAYVRSGPVTSRPVLFVPGGPGLASVVPYLRFRAQAARRGLDVLMVEHRGTGLSRRDHGGRDLPVDEVTVEAAADDLAAVLDAVGVERAVVHGSSYGSYLTQVFGVRHPHRVAAMVLDSPMLSVEGDLAVSRAYRRRLFWNGADPATAEVATVVRAAAAAGVPMAELVAVTQVVHEFAGPEVLRRLLLARTADRLGRTWRRVVRLGREEFEGPGTPYVHEPDLVAGIAYGQLGFGLPPDGGPMDPQLVFADAAERAPAFRGEPLDLPSVVPGFTWPTVVVSGDRDLRTPRPVAERLTGLVPGAVLVPLAGLGHSALDTHQLAALHIAHAAVAGATDRLPALAGRLAALPGRGPSRLVGTAVAAVVTAASTLRPV
ncbi:alpha/beta hydrolase family protein [Kineococcus sp. SYSU DK003]|uniref:alpha/beta hydrolase family protein n=1 Tax=Kineococcus sp. SYSU DK003 TaxID=3383124 RepID=UPI003D7DB729